MIKKAVTLAMTVALIGTMTVPNTYADTSYTVKAGDTLGGIADHYNMDYKMLGDYNQLDNYNLIELGQKILIPSESTAELLQPTMPVYINTTGGDIAGFQFDGVQTFYGVPYGTAERFQMPKPAQWKGLKTALTLGAVSPQRTESDSTNITDFYSLQNNVLENEKDCLNLNIWTNGSKEKKPVIVWLHGGGYSVGSSAEYEYYEGDQLAKKDAVVVSVNHRLNVLGYLDVSDYGDQYKYSGNAGMADIVLALQWVRDNIAKFGGDPSNVTIMGQSGGGSKVDVLMGMPAAKGLFQKGFSLSGGSVNDGIAQETAKENTQKLVEQLGLNQLPKDQIIESLSTMTYEELMTAAKEANISTSPVVDGEYYPDGTYAMSKDIPYMISSVFSEMNSNFSNVFIAQNENQFNQMALKEMTDEQAATQYRTKYGDYAEDIMAAFKKAYPDKSLAEGLYINPRKGGFGDPLGLAEAMDSYGGKAYVCVAAYDFPHFGGVTPVHTQGDLPLWFNQLEDIKPMIAGDVVKATEVSDEMSNALIQFAKTGNPSTSTLKWDNYTPENGATMVFDREAEVRYHHDDALTQLINEATAANGNRQ